MVLVVFSEKDEGIREDLQSFCDDLFNGCGWKLCCVERFESIGPVGMSGRFQNVTAMVLLLSRECGERIRHWRELRAWAGAGSHRDHELPVLCLVLETEVRGLSGDAFRRAITVDFVQEAAAPSASRTRSDKLMEAGSGLLALMLEMERPLINEELNGISLPRVSEALVVLARPAARQVEILVQAGNGIWYPQRPVPRGGRTSRIVLGSEEPGQNGLVFSITAITVDVPLIEDAEWTQVPQHRTRSRSVTVYKQ